MTRAYIRLDPAFDEHKETYPDGPYAALIATLCLAEHQPERGRFRSLDYLARLLGKRGRHARYLMDHGDLIQLDDGRVYVDGWDEWQEGDWKVSERVGRIRNRAKRTVPVTPPVTVDVTPDVTLHPTEADETLRQNVGGGGDRAEAGQPPPPDEPHDPWDAPEQEAIAWLARHGCSVVPGNGYHRQLITAVERHGVNAIVGMMDRLAAAGTKQGDLQGFLFGAINAVDKASRPNLTELDKEDRALESRDARRRGVERTKRLAHENGFHREEPSPGCPACSVEVPA